MLGVLSKKAHHLFTLDSKTKKRRFLAEWVANRRLQDLKEDMENIIPLNFFFFFCVFRFAVSDFQNFNYKNITNNNKLIKANTWHHDYHTVMYEKKKYFGILSFLHPTLWEISIYVTAWGLAKTPSSPTYPWADSSQGQLVVYESVCM